MICDQLCLHNYSNVVFSGHYVDLSDVLSDNDVDLSDLFVDRYNVDILDNFAVICMALTGQ